MAVETRTVQFRVDPAFAAYLNWIDDTSREFDVQTFDVFAAGYRIRANEEACANYQEAARADQGGQE